jgi:hypothetical protein
MIGRSTTGQQGGKATRPIRSLVAGGQLVAYGGRGSANSKSAPASTQRPQWQSPWQSRQTEGLDRFPLRLARAVAASAVMVEAGCFCAGCAVSELVAPELSANLKEVSAEKCDSLPGPMSVRRARFYRNTWKRRWASNEKTTQVGPFEAIFVSAKPCPAIPSPYLPPARTNPRWIAA